AVARDGSPAYTPAELAAQPEALRESADGALVGVLGLHLPPTALTRVGGSCHVIRAGSQGSAETVVVGAPQVVILRSRSRAPIAVARIEGPHATGLVALSAQVVLIATFVAGVGLRTSVTYRVGAGVWSPRSALHGALRASLSLGFVGAIVGMGVYALLRHSAM